MCAVPLQNFVVRSLFTLFLCPFTIFWCTQSLYNILVYAVPLQYFGVRSPFTTFWCAQSLYNILVCAVPLQYSGVRSPFTKFVKCRYQSFCGFLYVCMLFRGFYYQCFRNIFSSYFNVCINLKSKTNKKLKNLKTSLICVYNVSFAFFYIRYNSGIH